MKHTNNKTETLYESSGKSGVIVSILLILSVLFNISALIAPFYTAKIFMKSAYTFTLPHSILALWNHHLIYIAILIFSFSILFPFLKLAVLFYSWFICRNKNKRGKLITVVGPLGKWSMLDIFVTVILLVLTNHQFIITASLKIGVYFFLIAIFLSMTCALRMEILVFDRVFQSRTGKRYFIQRQRTGNISRACRILAVIALILSLTALFLTIDIPFIQIKGFAFVHKKYSILTSAITLWNKSKILTFFICLTLILCPLFHILGLMIIRIRKLKTKYVYIIERLTHVISAFNMLDVFCLALFIFMAEGGKLIITEAKNGLYMLLVFLFCAYLFSRKPWGHPLEASVK